MRDRIRIVKALLMVFGLPWLVSCASAATGGGLRDRADFVACTDPRPQMCTREYRPVCGLRDTGVRCATEPCGGATEMRTYGNGCGACADPAVIGHAPGACEEAPAPLATRPLGLSFSSVLEQVPAAGEPDARIAYGSAASQYAELWLPDGQGPHPLVVFIHGGCWLDEFSVDHGRPLAAALRDAGYAVLTPEYRRLGDAGGGWPGTFDDVGAVLDWVPELVDRHGLDVGRIAVAGHSAGGHLALWAGARPDFGSDHPFRAEEPLRPRAVIALAAITDLAGYAEGESSCETAAARLLDGQDWRNGYISPVQAPASGAEIVLIQGSEDSIVPVVQARAYARAAALAGTSGRVELIDGAGHFDLIHPASAVWPVLLDSLAAALSTTAPGGSGS